MTTLGGRIYSVSSPPAPPLTDDEIKGAIDLIVAKSIRLTAKVQQLSARVQQLETALDALLMAIDSEGEGLIKAVTEARRVRRGE